MNLDLFFFFFVVVLKESLFNCSGIEDYEIKSLKLTYKNVQPTKREISLFWLIVKV